MYGLAAIQHANGWAMAGAGACIVLTGLTMLSFLISLIPRLTGFFEAKALAPTEPAVEETKPETTIPDKLPDDLEAASTIYIALTEGLGKEFTLVDLHRSTKQVGLPHPHLSISRFRDAGILVPVGKGQFTWKPISD